LGVAKVSVLPDLDVEKVRRFCAERILAKLASR
jgi:hypothetical protein